MLDIRQLFYFVAVAEEEHVGRAAERLHISQSPLSRQIAQLEERLGLVLFERSQQRLRLTVDGQTFLAETKAFLVHADRLESMARRLGKGDEGGLCIGYLENAMYSGVLPKALKILRESRPTVHVALYNYHSSEQLEGLRQRSLDIALVREPPPLEDPDLECANVLNEPMLLALPDWHPLASASTINSSDLNAQKWIGVVNKDSPLKQDDFLAACAMAGFTPDVTMEATQPLAALELVGAGLGITMIQHSLRHQAPAGVLLKELAWFTYRSVLWAAWHKVNLRPLVTVFRQTLLASVEI